MHVPARPSVLAAAPLIKSGPCGQEGGNERRPPAASFWSAGLHAASSDMHMHMHMHMGRACSRTALVRTVPPTLQVYRTQLP